MTPPLLRFSENSSVLVALTVPYVYYIWMFLFVCGFVFVIVYVSELVFVFGC